MGLFDQSGPELHVDNGLLLLDFQLAFLVLVLLPLGLLRVLLSAATDLFLQLHVQLVDLSLVLQQVVDLVEHDLLSELQVSDSVLSHLDVSLELVVVLLHVVGRLLLLDE